MISFLGNGHKNVCFLCYIISNFSLNLINLGFNYLPVFLKATPVTTLSNQ
jgi:hypothetical protein